MSDNWLTVSRPSSQSSIRQTLGVDLNDPITSSPPCLYYCKKQPYEGKDFLQFPVRTGYPKCNLSDDENPFWVYEKNKPSETLRLAQFLQAWIFFGLPYQVLHRHGLYQADDYVEKNDSGADVVHMRGLPAKLSAWHELTLSWTREEKLKELEILRKCMRAAEQGMDALLLECHADWDRALTWSVGIMFQTVETVVFYALHDSRIHDKYCPNIPMSTSEFEDMTLNGWCPTAINAATPVFASAPARFYLMHMKGNEIAADHLKCGNMGCLKLQIDLATYHPSHAREDCCCQLLGPDTADVIEILRQGSFPVLRIEGTNFDDISITAETFRDNVAYIALSHVWADGLGNPNSNKLPRCQLLRLMHLARRLQGCSFTHVRFRTDGTTDLEERREDRPLYLWCDSICCPVYDPDVSIERVVAEEMKTVAINRLQDVYKQAAYVLVLDRGLQCTHFAGLTPVEAAARLITCRWMKRLWTYQEAGLASKLLVQFADQVVDVRALLDVLDNIPYANLGQRLLANEITASIRQLRQWFDRPGNMGHKNRGDIVMALYHRRCSVPQDEPTCIAAALNLNVRKIVTAHSHDAEKRMMELWRQVYHSAQGIPQAIVFNNLPRLSEPGFRWAPATIQQSIGRSVTLDLVFQDSVPPPVLGELTSHGLRVKLQGWRVQFVGKPGQMPEGLDPPVPPIERRQLWIRNQQGRFYVLTQDEAYASDQGYLLDLVRPLSHSELFVIISSRQNWYVGSSLPALLAVRTSDSLSYCTIAVVRLVEFRSLWTEMFQKVYAKGMTLRKSKRTSILSATVKLEKRIQNLNAAHFVRQVVELLIGVPLLIIQALIAAMISWSVRRGKFAVAMPVEHGNVFLEEANISTSIAMIYLGIFAQVVETFDTNQAWHID